jgi:type VI secretion system protein ImpF
MADSSARYKPYVLKRLTDLHPDEPDEAYSPVISMNDVEADIYDNLVTLFNSSSHPSLSEMKGYAELEHSVLGYGIEDYCGAVTSRDDRENLRVNIERQIKFFEPRLAPKTVRVEIVESALGVSAEMQFRISGHVTVAEADKELVFLSKLDVETGRAELEAFA